MPRRIDSILLYSKTGPDFDIDRLETPKETIKSFQTLMTETAGKASKLATNEQHVVKNTTTKSTIDDHGNFKTVAEELESHRIIRRVQENTAWLQQRAKPITTRGATRPVNTPHLTGHLLSPARPPTLIPAVAPVPTSHEPKRRGRSGRAGKFHRQDLLPLHPHHYLAGCRFQHLFLE